MRFKVIFYIANIILLSACIKDPCNRIFCSERGECIDGRCFCEDLYTGDICVSFATYFSGTYLTKSTCNDTTYNTSILVYRGQLDSILIDNFLNTDWQLIGRVTNDSLLEIETPGAFTDTIDNFINKYEITQPFKIEGNPKDTLKGTLYYNINGKDSICNIKYIKNP